MNNFQTEKKRILIVEDEKVNLELLKIVLQNDYDLLTAENGTDALEIINNESTLSLVLLDLNLPDMGGLDILDQMKEEGRLGNLPVIVLTAEKEAEVESLDIGASDFISKPYPRPEVINARVRRTIELSEGRMIIGQTENDSLTGLYTREYFYSYCERFDKNHPTKEMDALVVNINHFHFINERYGRKYADEVLKRIADRIRAIVDENGGLASRREADNFVVYMPHETRYTEMLEEISEGASGEGKDENTVRLRMGVYPKVDKALDIERRFDRAKMAADTVRSTFTKAVAIYDDALHESSKFSEQLLIDFSRAIEDEQFVVHYQPKYDIRGEEAVLASCEALVRWEHPEFGLVSPGLFIHLFEQNGLIQRLDSYVWRAAARQISEWKNRLGISVPVSVNVSRVDMFDTHLVDEIDGLVGEFNLEHKDLMLEVTESAYTEDSDHIIDTVTSLRDRGFYIEMDDFGSGYSSLNMLSNLPIDALKLDMQFIRNAFKNGKNTRMLEIVIEIADSLNVPVIAEGVETAEQLFTLKSMGCDIVQGYYFSKPVPAGEFEEFLIEKKEQGGEVINMERNKYRKLAHDRHIYDAMHDPVTGLYNGSAFNFLLYDSDRKHTALLLLELSNFEDISKAKGSSSANRAVIRAAEMLREIFRASDFICRLKNDEIGVILSRIESEQRPVIEEKVSSFIKDISEDEHDIPGIEVNFGLVFGDVEKKFDLFKAADESLKTNKQK